MIEEKEPEWNFDSVDDLELHNNVFKYKSGEQLVFGSNLLRGNKGLNCKNKLI